MSSTLGGSHVLLSWRQGGFCVALSGPVLRAPGEPEATLPPSVCQQLLLQVNPYHVDSLLQLSDVCRMQEDQEMARDLVGKKWRPPGKASLQGWLMPAWVMPRRLLLPGVGTNRWPSGGGVLGANEGAYRFISVGSAKCDFSVLPVKGLMKSKHSIPMSCPASFLREGPLHPGVRLPPHVQPHQWDLQA